MSAPDFTCEDLLSLLDVYELGFISENQIWVYFSSSGIKLTSREIRVVLAALDVDHDGKITLSDLEQFFS